MNVASSGVLRSWKPAIEECRRLRKGTRDGGKRMLGIKCMSGSRGCGDGAVALGMMAVMRSSAVEKLNNFLT